ncbi:MAG: amidohydrolase family protein [Bacteroidetes bacterium]|nr:amidohydrolase family protein [Bacteroidota bacterium]
MRFISADHIFSAHTGFISNGILAIEEDGTISDLIDPTKNNSFPDPEKSEGIICPGFINAHCHLELSHLRGKIEKHTGFAGFAKQVMPMRGEFSHEEIIAASEKAEKEMIANGIVGVGDIVNSVDTFELKEKNNLRYHTFIELISLNPKMAEKAAEVGMFLKDHCPQTSSISPHAPYSVSNELLEIIGNLSRGEEMPITMHNQESEAESEFFRRGTGPVRELYDFLGIDISWFKPSGVNSLRSKLKYLPVNRNLILVHNTFTSPDDITWAEYYSKSIYWCFCPGANLYIENKLPAFKNFMDAKVKMIVGTDSLASNEKLSVFGELKIIAQHEENISSAELLTWATKNGAEALKMNDLGTFEKGKKPGVNLLSGVTPEKISPEAKVKKLI